MEKTEILGEFRDKNGPFSGEFRLAPFDSRAEAKR